MPPKKLTSFAMAGLLWVLPHIPAEAAGEIHLSDSAVKGVFGDAFDTTETKADWSSARTQKPLPTYKATPLTVELWCKLGGLDNYNILISNEPKESATHWEIYTDINTGVLCAYMPAFKPSVIRSAKNLVDGKWHSVAVVLEDQSVALFADGREETRMAITKNPEGKVIAGSLVVGQALVGSGNIGCNGAIDEVRISSCARKIEDIPSEPFAADAQTVGLWSFDVKPGAREFADASTNHNAMQVVASGSCSSLSALDRIGFNPGPAPMESKAVTVPLRKGGLPTPKPASVFSLEGEWQMQFNDKDIAEAELTVPWEKCLKAQVPGSVHTALYQSAFIPFPYIGKNQEITKPWSYTKTYYYKKTFTRPPKGQDETLVFDGVCNRCAVYLNGANLGTHEGMFTRFAFPVKHLLRDENTLVVKLEPSTPRWETTVVFNNSFGWHYSMFPPLGIWRSVSIHGEPTVKMESPFVATRDAKGGVVDLVTSLEGDKNGCEGKLTGVIAPENFKGETYSFEREIASKGRSQEVHLRFSVPDPHLWWPVDMGEPNLYKLRLAFEPKGGGQPDVRDITFGIRTVKMEPVNGRPDPNLLDWTFVINGQPMFVKGAGWCTPDAMMDFSRARYDRQLTLAASQHIQMLRAWGSGMVETEDFYDLCNRKGIMVMQEWPTAWNSHNKQPLNLLEETVRQGILRLRNHPALAIYTGGNESDKPFGPAIDMMGRLSVELDGTRDFHRGEGRGGSQHDYTVYWGGGPLDHAFTMQSVFYGEFGIASYPDYESVQRFLPDNEKNLWPPPEDGSFAFHTPVFNTHKDLERQTRMAHFFTASETMERFIVGTQLAQAVGVRHALERARSRWPKSTGALYYKLNDNCPAASWSTVDWYGAPKIGHYLIKDSFSPLVAVALFPRANSVGVPLALPIHLLDDADALKDTPWEVLVRAYGADLKLIKETRFNGRGSIPKVKPLGEFTLEAAQTKTTPLLMVLDVLKQGQLVQRNYNFTNFEPVKDCLFNLPRSSVSMTAREGTVVVQNTGPFPAVGVNIGRPGHLDTFTADDNYFWLDAGETKTVKVSETDGVVVDGWNLEKPNP